MPTLCKAYGSRKFIYTHYFWFKEHLEAKFAELERYIHLPITLLLICSRAFVLEHHISPVITVMNYWSVLHNSVEQQNKLAGIFL
jgi:hypothetical protein